MDTPKPATPNHELIRECIGGDADAFRLLVARLQPSLVHYAWGFTLDMARAEEASLAVVRTVFAHLPRLRHNSLLSSYAIGLLRKELKKQGLAAAPANVPASWAALAGLPRVQREVVFLFFQGTSITDIAHIRREPPSHTRTRLTRALVHVARRTALAGPYMPGLPPPRCFRVDHVYLAVADELPRHERAPFKEHVGRCPACAAQLAAAEKLFAALRKEIGPFLARPPLTTVQPGPSRLATFVGAAAVVAVAFAAFLALRSVFGPAALPVTETPAGQTQPVGTP